MPQLNWDQNGNGRIVEFEPTLSLIISQTQNVDSELMEIVPGFLDNRRDDVTTMVGALEEGDFETIRVLGHDMKGSGGGYGFDGITDIGQSLEQAAKDQDQTGIRKLVQDLVNYVERVEVVYE